MEDHVFEIKDKFGKIIHLTKERLKHIQKHPYMQDPVEYIKDTLGDPLSITYFEDNENVKYYYKEYKNRSSLERYLLISVKYLNGEGFIITSFFTNRIEGIKWKAK